MLLKQRQIKLVTSSYQQSQQDFIAFMIAIVDSIASQQKRGQN